MISGEKGRAFIRWMTSAGVVLLAHAGAALAVVSWPDPSTPGEPAMAIVIDLAPLPVAPSEPEQELPPGPKQVQSEVAPEPEEQQKRVPEPEPPTPELASTPNPEVAMTPPPEPPRPPDEPRQKKPDLPKKKVEPRPLVRTTSAPQTTRVSTATALAAPAQGQPNLSPSNAAPTWRSALVSQLERNKRYPQESQARREQGTAQLAFTIDRSGRVLSSRIVHSSGSSTLDQETLALVRRAEPLPPPPPEVPGTAINVTVPIRYAIR